MNINQWHIYFYKTKCILKMLVKQSTKINQQSPWSDKLPINFLIIETTTALLSTLYLILSIFFSTRLQM